MDHLALTAGSPADLALTTGSIDTALLLQVSIEYLALITDSMNGLVGNSLAPQMILLSQLVPGIVIISYQFMPLL